MAYNDDQTSHIPACRHGLCLRQAFLKHPSRYSPYSIRRAASAEECSDQYSADLSLNEQPARVPPSNLPRQHSLAPQSGNAPHESHNPAAQQSQQYVTAFQEQQAQSEPYQGGTQQAEQQFSELLKPQQQDCCFPAMEPKQDVLVNVAISLCARALNKAVRAFQTAHHVCMFAPDSAAADKTLELAENLMDTTMRRLRLAQNLAAVHHQGCVDDGTAAAVTAPATWRPGITIGSLHAPPADSHATSASLGAMVTSGSSVQQQQQHLSLQEEVCSSWEC